MTNVNAFAQGLTQAAKQATGGDVALRSSMAQGSAVPFANVLQSMVHETSALDMKAQQAVTGLLDGSGVELHEAMMATQKADLAFSLALEMRNKAVAAYQQMMTMQF